MISNKYDVFCAGQSETGFRLHDRLPELSQQDDGIFVGPVDEVPGVALLLTADADLNIYPLPPRLGLLGLWLQVLSP